MGDVIELTIPVRADLVVLARLTAATVAGRAGFGVEDIEDLRLAVDELCVSVVRQHDDGHLRLRFTQEGDAIEITCAFEPVSPAPAGAAPADRGEDGLDDLSSRILDALVDEHGRETAAQRRAWLRKHRDHQSADDQRASLR